MKNTLVFYHGRCTDGFGAAFAAWLKFGRSAQYIACYYDDPPPPSVKGKQVYILDFAFEWDVMQRLSSEARELVLLDHHESSKKKLHGFKCQCGSLTFDLNRSGSVMAWSHFFPGVKVPRLFKYIQDRDLWSWKYPDSQSFLTALDALDFDFQQWKTVLDMEPDQAEVFLERGRAMNVRFEALCDSMANKAMPVTLLGFKGLTVNASSEFNSEVGARLAKKSGAFGAVWALHKKGTIKVSLRSTPSFNCRELAERFGGGGHDCAASFYLPLERLGAFLEGTLSP